MGFPGLLLLLPLLCGRHLLEQVVVQEGLCARVSCSFDFPRLLVNSHLTFYWFREQDNEHTDNPVATSSPWRWVKTEVKGRFQLLGNPRGLNCSLGLSDAWITDQGTYFFRTEQGNVTYSYRAKKLRVLVTALTEKPTIHVAEPLVSGLPRYLTCSLPGACEETRLEFSWSGEMLGPGTHNSLGLIRTPEPQDHGRNLSCRVRLQKTTERTIPLNVSYAPQSMAVEVFQHNWTGSIVDSLRGSPEPPGVTPEHRAWRTP